jgi:hypothetical protein
MLIAKQARATPPYLSNQVLDARGHDISGSESSRKEAKGGSPPFDEPASYQSGIGHIASGADAKGRQHPKEYIKMPYLVAQAAGGGGYRQ